MIALTEMVRRSADYMLSPYLDAPTPPSLEMLPVPGERETVTIEDKTCFVYVLLSSDGKRYGGSYSTGSGFSIPALPKKVGILIPTFRHQVRNLVRPEPESRDFSSIEQALKQALAESAIVEYREGVYGILGTTESEIRQLLYLPAENSVEADQKMNTYREKVTTILQPNRLECNFKIKPVIKPGKILSIPHSLQESYFGHGC